MKLNAIYIALLSGTTALTACSDGSQVVSRAGNASEDQVLAETSGNAAEALEDGETLRASARTIGGVFRVYDDQTGELLDDSYVKVTRNDEGGLDVEVDGRTIRFTADHLTEDGYGFELPDGTASIWAWSGDSMADALDPENGSYSLVFDHHADSEDGSTGKSAFHVVGTETAAGDLAALPTATYEGWSRVRVAPPEGFDNWNAKVSEARGDVTLTANFGSGTVSGGITNMESRLPRDEDPDRNWTPFDGTVTLEEADITGNGFTGGISADADFNSAIGTLDPSSSYSGTFFGPEAEEVAGGINLTGTSVDGDAFIGWGVWQAWMQ